MENQMAMDPNCACEPYWMQRLYKHADHYDADCKFWENAQKSAHLEGKMGAREMSFAKGGGLPTHLPLQRDPGTP